MPVWEQVRSEQSIPACEQEGREHDCVGTRASEQCSLPSSLEGSEQTCVGASGK